MQDLLIRAGCFVAIIILGIVLRRVGFFKENAFEVLSKVVLKITLPAAVVKNLAGSTIDASMLSLAALALLCGVMYMVVAYLVNLRGTKEQRAFAVVNLPVDEAALDVMPLESDRLVLVAPKEYESMLDVTDDGLDFRSCKELLFVVVGQSQEMRQLFDQLCSLADFSPNVAAEVVSLTTAWAMVCAGVGATILPLQYVKSMPRQENVFVAKLRDAVYFRQPAVITKRGQYLSEATRYAIQVLTELFKEI